MFLNISMLIKVCLQREAKKISRETSKRSKIESFFGRGTSQMIIEIVSDDNIDIVMWLLRRFMIKNGRNLLTLPCLICLVLRSNLPTRSNIQSSLKLYRCSACKLDILPVSSARTPPSGRSLSLCPFSLAAEMKK